MKSGVAAFVAAAMDFVTETPPDGAVILTITGDEEGVSTDGTVAILDWMARRRSGWRPAWSASRPARSGFGEMIKIGRRGAMTGYFTATGVQGHSAYPHRAKNPVPALARLIDRLSSARLDEGTAHFDASTLAAVTFDTGNPASNVIPAEARATVNLRFNDAHSSASLTGWLRDEAAAVSAETGVKIELEVQVSGESFLTPPGALSALVGAGGRGRDRGDAGAVDLGRNLGRAVRQAPLPGGRIRAGRPAPCIRSTSGSRWRRSRR